MKYILFFMLLTVLNAAAQTGKPLTKVVIKYYKGYDPFNQSGVYSRGEIFEISAVNDSLFRINHYFKITDTQVDSSIIKKDTVEIRLGSNQLIPKKVIDYLSIQLNTTKDNFDISFIKPQLKKPTKKQILAIATKLNKHDEFEKEYVDDAKQRITKIKNFDKLDSFINLNKPHYDIIQPADVSDNLDVSFIFAKDTLNYVGSPDHLLGQPFLRPDGIKIYKEGAQITKITINQTLNLEINNLLKDILPRSSALRKRLDINSLTYWYIDWYIDKVL